MIKIFYCLRAKDLNGPLKLATYLLSTYQVSIRAFEPPNFCHLSGLKLLGQKSKQKCPDLSPPSYLVYLIQVLAVPKLAIFPVCSGSLLGPSPDRTYPKTLPLEA